MADSGRTLSGNRVGSTKVPEPVFALLSFVLSLITLAVAAGLLMLLYRARNARAELTKAQHDTALALDRRCDVLQHQLDDLALRQRIDQVLDLVTISESQGCLDHDATRRLERYVLDLRDEQQRTAEAA